MTPVAFDLDQHRERIGAVVFGIGLVASIPLLLHFGRHQWFFLDEFQFLGERELTDGDDLVRAHNEHWVTVPLIAYRALWSAVGLRSYVPYQLLAVLSHLTIAVMLRLVLRRIGLGPWAAGILVVPFVLFGSGYQNILWGFQVAFNGAVAAGLAHLLLADHPGQEWERRDTMGLGVGAIGLMCSGIALPMTVGVGASVWMRRGPRLAAAHTVPLAALFGVWWLLFAIDEQDGRPLTWTRMPDFAWRLVSHAVADVGRLGSTGGTAALGWLMVIGCGVGLVLWWRSGGGARRAELAPVLGSLVALAAVVAITTLGRADIGIGLAEEGRYTHVLYALAVPATGLAVLGAQRRHLGAGAALMVALLVGLPGNIAAFDHRDLQRRLGEGRPELVAAIVQHPEAAAAPGDLRPLPTFGFGMTMDWLRAAERDGRLPDWEQANPMLADEAQFRLSFVQREGSIVAPCRELVGPMDIRVDGGHRLGLAGGLVAISLLADGEPAGPSVSFFPREGAAVEVVRGPLDIRLRAQALNVGSLCALE